MKTLYVIVSQSAWGEVWIDKDANLISYIHENDGGYRVEYMSFIPEYFGGRIIQLDSTKLDEKASKIKEDGYDDAEEYVKDLKKDILKLIKKAK